MTWIRFVVILTEAQPKAREAQDLYESFIDYILSIRNCP